MMTYALELPDSSPGPGPMGGPRVRLPSLARVLVSLRPLIGSNHQSVCLRKQGAGKGCRGTPA